MPTKKPATKTATKKPAIKIPAWMKTWKMSDKNPKEEDNFFLCIGMNEEQEGELTDLLNTANKKGEWPTLIRKLMELDISEDVKRMAMFKIGIALQKQQNPFAQLISQIGK